ncbi:MAG: nucleoside 2-deoxyribosyltransferase [Bacteroidota bacterium]
MPTHREGFQTLPTGGRTESGEKKELDKVLNHFELSLNTMTAYFGISKSKRGEFDQEVDSVRKVLNNYNVTLEVFVDKYEFTSQQEKEMMETAFSEIDNCELMIVELTTKAIGVGVEVGYAKAKNKPIIYLKKGDAKYSTTVGGSANHFIEYSDEGELETKLEAVMDELKKTTLT